LYVPLGYHNLAPSRDRQCAYKRNFEAH